MKEHTYQVHTLAVDQTTAEAAKIAAEASKVQTEAAKVSAAADMVRAENTGTRGAGDQGKKKAIMTRLTLEESISETDWSFFVAKFAAPE